YSVGLTTHGFEGPCADVTNFAIDVIVPAGPWNSIGDGFTELVRTSPGHCIESLQSFKATAACRVRHDCVVNVTGIVVITAVALPRAASAHYRNDPGDRDK